MKKWIIPNVTTEYDLMRDRLVNEGWQLTMGESKFLNFLTRLSHQVTTINLELDINEGIVTMRLRDARKMP